MNNNFSSKLNSIRRRPQVVINQNPENDNDYRKSKFVPGDKLYIEVGKHHSSTSNNNNIVAFGDSIPNFSGKCKYDFNRNIISGRARFKHFPGATSKDLLCYVDATLQDATYDAAIIHVGVNYILNNQSHDQTTQLMCNLRKISTKCRSYGIKYVFVSGLLYTSKIKENLLADINRMIKELCMSDGYEYIDNDNIPRDMLYNDALHILDKGKYFFI